MIKTLRSIANIAALLILAAAVAIAAMWSPIASGQDAGEPLERRADMRAKIQAWDRAERQGLTAVDDTAKPEVATPGWSNEKVFSKFNDWEPNVAADPSSDYVYMTTTQYGGPKACGTCPRSGTIPLRVSADGGKTFGPQQFLCTCEGHNWQADPVITTDADGDLYATFLSNPFGAFFVRSTDRGQTWTAPVQVLPPTKKIPWNDHPWLAVSPDGQDVYVGTNKSDNYQVTSHDYGQTWGEPVKTNDNGRYYFALGGEVMPNGDVVFVDAAFSNAGQSLGRVNAVVIRSEDDGATWTEQVIDQSAPMRACTSPGCPAYQYGLEMALAQSGNGDLMTVYNAWRRAGGGSQVYVSTSSDNGATWSEPTRISQQLGRITAAFPQIAGGDGDRFTVAWADNRNGRRRFNTWARDTLDAGETWSPDARLSNRGTGAGYKHPAGYQFSYGDYFDIAINDDQEAFSAWGESYSYNGPGGTWYNVQDAPPFA